MDENKSLPMSPFSLEHIQFQVGSEATLLQMQQERVLAPFSDEAIAFLDFLSKTLLKNPRAKEYPDVATFAFWCRKSSILQQRKPYADLQDRLGRGIVFHVAPSNVAVNFAYSMVAALLAGNRSVVRLPSKDFEQVGLICEALNAAITEHEQMRNAICLLQYGHEKEVTDMLSLLCDVRIIWGGDNTIRTIRTSPLKPEAAEITFADRYSIAVIDADHYLEMKDKDKVTHDFYNDTYLTDQNACTSPKLVIWTGDKTQEAQHIFWHELERLVRERYTLSPMQAIDKWSALCRLGAVYGGAGKIAQENNLIVRIKLDKVGCDIMDYSAHSGYFFEYHAQTLDEILPICGRRCQTLAYFGIDEQDFKKFIQECRPAGVDRIVPIGKTLDFSLVWDGIDLIGALSRKICRRD